MMQYGAGSSLLNEFQEDVFICGEGLLTMTSWQSSTRCTCPDALCQGALRFSGRLQSRKGMLRNPKAWRSCDSLRSDTPAGRQHGARPSPIRQLPIWEGEWKVCMPRWFYAGLKWCKQDGVGWESRGVFRERWGRGDIIKREKQDRKELDYVR